MAWFSSERELPWDKRVELILSQLGGEEHFCPVCRTKLVCTEVGRGKVGKASCHDATPHLDAACCGKSWEITRGLSPGEIVIKEEPIRGFSPIIFGSI